VLKNNQSSNVASERQHLAGLLGRQDDGDPIYIFVLQGEPGF